MSHALDPRRLGTIPDWLPNTGKPSAAELNRLHAPRTSVAAANTVIPIVYGRDRVDGKVFFAHVDEAQGFLYLGFLICEGEIDGYDAVFVDNVDITASKGLLSYAGAAVESYTGTPDQLPSPLLIEAVETMPSSVYDDALPNTAYIVIKVPKKAGAGFPRLQAIVRGRKVYDPRKDEGVGGDHRLDDPDTWEFSTNPALCAADFVVRHAGWAVDWDSVADTADANDELLSDGSKRREIGLTLDTPATATSWMQGFRTYMGAFLAWDGDQLQFIPDRADVDPTHPDFESDLDSGNWEQHGVAYHFTPDDIREGSLRLEHRSSRNTPNSIIIQYTDAAYDDKWVMDRVQVDHPSLNFGAVRRNSTISLPGIHRRSQAKREAIERLNWFINDLEGSLTVFDEGMVVKTGSIIAITHPRGLNKKLFRVTRVTAEAGRWTLSISEYSHEAYSDEVVDDVERPDTDLGSGGMAVPTVTNLIADEELFEYQNGESGSRVRATWDHVDSPYFEHYVVEGRVGGNIVFQTTTEVAEVVTAPTEQLVGGVPVIYTIRVAVKFETTRGEYATASTTIAGRTASPLDVPSVTPTRTGADQVDLKWVEPAQNDIKTYEVRTGTTAVWADGVVRMRVRATDCTIKNLPAGQTYFMVKAIDSVGNESANAASAPLTLTAPTAPGPVTCVDLGEAVDLRWRNPILYPYHKHFVVSMIPPGGSEIEVIQTPNSRHVITGLALGEYTFLVKAVNLAGWESPQASVTAEVTMAEWRQSVNDTLQEIADLSDELTGELQDLADDLQAEASARAQALLDERLAWEAAVSEEALIRQSGDESLAAQISSISAGTGEQFDAATIWHFDSDVEGWTGTNLAAAGGFLTIGTSSTTTPYAQSPELTAPFDSNIYRYVKVRLKRVGTPTWSGRLRWITSTDTTWNATKEVSVPEPAWDASDVATIDFKDIDWPGNVTAIRLHLIDGPTNVGSNTIRHDWIAVGRPSPGASAAALQEERVARIAGDAAEATARNMLASQLRGNVTGSDATALEQLTTGLLYQERQARTAADSAMASDITSLTSRITDAENVNTSQATALTALTTRVTDVENVNTAQATQLSNLTSEVAGKASSAALSALTTRVTNAENSISSQSSSITSLQTALSLGGPGTNLLRNGGFEQYSSASSTPTNWTANGNLTSVTQSKPSSDLPDSKNFARAQGTASSSSNYYGYYQAVPARVGARYSAAYMIKGTNINRARLYMQWVDGSDNVVQTSQTPEIPVGSSWTKISLTDVPCPAGATACRIFLRGFATGAGTCTIDYDNAIFAESSIAVNYAPNAQDLHDVVSAAVSANASALSALSTTVSSHGSTISSHTTSINTLNSSVGAANASISQIMQTAASAQTSSFLPLHNPGFEYDFGWCAFSGDGANNDGDTLVAQSAYWTPSPHSGARVMVFGYPGLEVSGSRYNISRRFAIDSSKRLRLTIWNRVTQGPANTADLYCQLRWYDGNNAYISASAVVDVDIVNRGWTKYQSGWVTPPSNAAYVRVLIGVQGSFTSGYCYVDDVTVEIETPAMAEVNAKVGLYLDVNGNISGYETTNNGVTSTFRIMANVFQIVSSGSGARTEYSNGNWRVYDSSGTLRVRLGVW